MAKKPEIKVCESILNWMNDSYFEAHLDSMRNGQGFLKVNQDGTIERILPSEYMATAEDMKEISKLILSKQIKGRWEK